jgi:hypothetical protein
VKRCEGALEKISGGYEQCDAPAEYHPDLFRQVAIISREPLNGKVERCRTRVLESVGLITHGLPSNEAGAGRSSQRPYCEES